MSDTATPTPMPDTATPTPTPTTPAKRRRAARPADWRIDATGPAASCATCSRLIVPDQRRIVDAQGAFRCARVECAPEVWRLASLAAPALDGLREQGQRLGERIDVLSRATGETFTSVRAELAALAARLEPRKCYWAAPNAAPAPLADGPAHECVPLLARELALGHRTLLWGPHGTGKTSAALRTARALGYRAILQPPARAAHDLLGWRTATGHFCDTPVAQWARSQEPAALVLDEVDRCDPSALVALNSVLSGDEIVLGDGCAVRVPETHVVVATANTDLSGATSDYTAAERQDAALVNRFAARIAWPTDEALEATLARSQHGATDAALLAARAVRKYLAGVRASAWSMRDTFALSRRLAAGCSLEEALQVSAVAGRPEAERKAALSAARVGGAQ